MSAIIRNIRPLKTDYRDNFINGKWRTGLLVALLLLVVFGFGCGDKTEPDPPKVSNAELSAVVQLPDGSLKHDLVLMVVNVDTFVSGKKAFYKVDTLFGRRSAFPQMDSTGRQVVDSATGRPVMVSGWVRISPDSISIINYTDVSFFIQKFDKNKSPINGNK